MPSSMFIVPGHTEPGVEQAVGQGGRMPIHISMEEDDNRSLPCQFLMALLPTVRLKLCDN